MIKRTKEEIDAKVRELWAPKEGEWHDAPTVEINDNNKDAIRISISAMYGHPPINIDLLLPLAEFFGGLDAVSINDDDRFSHGGCETCDYGSEYGFTLTVRPKIATKK